MRPRAKSESTRGKRGSAIAEMGPALFVLLVIIFFPMIDLMEVGAGYMMAQSFHDSMLRAIAVSQPTGGTQDPSIQTQATAISNVTNSFAGSGFASFLHVQATDLQVTNVTYLPSAANPTTVQVSTSVSVAPFISIPYFSPVPGLNAPVIFTSTSQRPQEELGKN